MSRKRARASPRDRDPLPRLADPPPSMAAGVTGLTKRPVIILGAGADVGHGLPTIANLMYELAEFARGDGAKVDAILRDKIKYLRFTFDKFAGDRSGALLTQLFEATSDFATTINRAAEKLSADPDMASVGDVIGRLCRLAADNQVSGQTLQALAHLAGEVGDVGAIEPLLDPQHILLTSIPSNAIRKAFQQALARGSSLTEEERDVLELFVVATSNVEQLLSDYFTRYCVGSAADRRTYLYLVWMLWAFLRSRSSTASPPSSSIYSSLPQLGGEIVTFNYTNFFEKETLPHVHFFHGRLDQYLRIDTRELVVNDPDLRDAKGVDSIVPFLRKCV
jgi:hypothetical protein